MTIRHLKIFITVADCGKMSLAAKKLYISQPSVSQAVQELEQYYEVKLFERLFQKLYITEHGKQLLSYARHVVDSFEMMDLYMKNAGEKSVIRIGASVSVGTCLLNKIIAKLEQQDEKTEVKVVVNNTAYIENLLLNSQLDIAIVEGLVTGRELVQEPLCKDELVILAGRNHPFYDREEISLEELQGQDVIAREDGSMVRNQLEQMLIENQIILNQKWSCTNTEAIKNTVIAGKEIAILSKLLVEREIKEGTLRILPIKDNKVIREIKLVYHRNKYISKSLYRFIEISREELK